MSKKFDLNDAFPEDIAEDAKVEKQKDVSNGGETDDNNEDVAGSEEKSKKAEKSLAPKTDHKESNDPKDFLDRKSVESKTYAFFMNPKDAELIKAIAEIQGKSQGETISYLIDEFIKGKKEKVIKIWQEYERRKELKDENLF